MFTSAAKHCFLSLRLWQNFTEMVNAATKRCFLSLSLWKNFAWTHQWSSFTVADSGSSVWRQKWTSRSSVYPSVTVEDSGSSIWLHWDGHCCHQTLLPESVTVTELHWYVHCCRQTLLPESATVTELHWYVHCCDEHTTKDMHSRIENWLTFNVLLPKG